MRKGLLCHLAIVLWIVTLVSCGGVSSGNSVLTAQQKVAAAKTALTIGFAAGDSAANVTQNLTLAAAGTDGTSISWVSSNPAVVSIAGLVTQPDLNDASVTLTATVAVDGVSDIKAFPLTVKAKVTDAQAVAAAKAALTITYASGDSASSVTRNVTLPSGGLYTSTISWSSSSTAVVTNAGVVSQPVTQDAGVTLTATITVGSTSDTKDFPITVKAQMTDAAAVAAAKSALAIGYGSGDSAASVTQNLTLPATGLDGTSVTWSSNDPSVVTNAGVVSQPSTADVSVTLTATITLRAASDTKGFAITVKAQMTDAEAVAAAKAALAIGYQAGDGPNTVTRNLTLPTSGADGCTVSWASSDPAILPNGTITQPITGDLPVTLTATITSNSASDTKVFIVTVKAQMTDEDAVAAAKAALAIGYAEGDSATSVSHNVSLPLTGSENCTISWSSDTPAVISNSGTVQQPPIGNAQVTLTATITSHATSDTASFTLTVRGQMSDQDAVAAAKAALNIIYASGDSAASVTQNVTLPTSGTSGSTITWSSSNTNLISNSGGVTVPTDNNASVTMTATLTYGSASDTDAFPLTVKALLLSAWVNSSAISPGNGAIEVDPGIVVRIPFQVALNPDTVNSETFQIVATSNAENVPIFVTYDDDSRIVRLTPRAPLLQDTEYSVTVNPTLRDSEDNALPSPMRFSFTTLSYNDILSQWKFNGDGSDASGNGNDLTDISGIFDTEVVHEGSASLYLEGGQNGASNISMGSQLTVAVWVNVDNPIQESINTIMANTDTGERSNGFKLCINRWETSDESVVIEVGDGSNGGKWITTPGLIQPGSWYHLAFVIDQPNQTMKIYYNGAEAPLSFASDEGRRQSDFRYDFKTSGPFLIGSFPDGVFGLKGHLDDMRVYNRVLSADEIAKIAQEK